MSPAAFALSFVASPEPCASASVLASAMASPCGLELPPQAPTTTQTPKGTRSIRTMSPPAQELRKRDATPSACKPRGGVCRNVPGRTSKRRQPVDDCDGTVIPTHDAPAHFALGTTTVIWKVTDLRPRDSHAASHRSARGRSVAGTSRDEVDTSKAVDRVVAALPLKAAPAST